ncbi:hypothetical protein MMC13_003043 [Lambiella insularis]|nr:hypothetical protein [Lambiella insularis]
MPSSPLSYLGADEPFVQLSSSKSDLLQELQALHHPEREAAKEPFYTAKRLVTDKVERLALNREYLCMRRAMGTRHTDEIAELVEDQWVLV